jgi:hypothetical protein
MDAGVTFLRSMKRSGLTYYVPNPYFLPILRTFGTYSIITLKICGVNTLYLKEINHDQCEGRCWLSCTIAALVKIRSIFLWPS